MKVGIISDTHGYCSEVMLSNLTLCDEIWHAGDWGSMQVYDEIAGTGKKIRGVFGNIDGKPLRILFPEINRFEADSLSIMMTHIGGYPGKYPSHVLNELKSDTPDIFISGHSHILKIIPDNSLNLLHMNPGASGQFGIHQVKTMIMMEIKSGKIKDIKVVEF